MKNSLGGIALIGTVLLISQFMYVLPIHIGVFFITILAVVVADLYGLAWVLGKVEKLSKNILNNLHIVVSAGLVVLITTGAIMAWPVQDYLLSTTSFIIKMLFVAALVINAFFIHTHTVIATTNTFSTLSSKEKIKLLVSGAVSGISWIGAFTTAQFLGL